MTTRTYGVRGMSCQHCVNAVTSSVTAVAGVEAAAVDLEQGTVTVTADHLDDAAIAAAIVDAGYEPVG